MDQSKLKEIARREVLDYAQQFYNCDMKEWIAAAGAMDLSTFDPNQFTDADIAIIYSFLADDYEVWTIEGSPNIDWTGDPAAAREFCEAWSSGTLLP